MNPYQNRHTTTILGLDIGTSGIRACLVERSQNNVERILAQHSLEMATASPQSNPAMATQNANVWLNTLKNLLDEFSQKNDLSQIDAIVCDATSSTVLLCDSSFQPLTEALMYNDTQSSEQAKQIEQTCLSQQVVSAANGASSTLAKTLFLKQKLEDNGGKNRALICHQIDIINHFFADFDYITDENNALKLGYDSQCNDWPDWVKKLLQANPQQTPDDLSETGLHITLPNVVPAGTALAHIKPAIANQYNINAKALLYAGTTDSIAGFLASGARNIGDAASSLGSTLAIKMITNKPVFSTKHGLYSHKLKDAWLVGGASNCGGLSLLQFYSLDELIKLLQSIEDDYKQYRVKTDCYPLSKQGERFPVADADKPALDLKLEKLNFNRSETVKQHQKALLNMINGLVNIELLAYQKLQQISQTPVKKIFSLGGGLKNRIWMQLRQQVLSNMAASTPLNQSRSIIVDKTTSNKTNVIEVKQANSAAFGVTRLID